MTSAVLAGRRDDQVVGRCPRAGCRVGDGAEVEDARRGSCASSLGAELAPARSARLTVRSSLDAARGRSTVRSFGVTGMPLTDDALDRLRAVGVDAADACACVGAVTSNGRPSHFTSSYRHGGGVVREDRIGAAGLDRGEEAALRCEMLWWPDGVNTPVKGVEVARARTRTRSRRCVRPHARRLVEREHAPLARGELRDRADRRPWSAVTHRCRVLADHSPGMPGSSRPGLPRIYTRL